MIIFSDSHIDNGHGVFAPHKKRFHNFLDFAEKEQLVIAGDLFEWWRFSPEETMAKNMDVIIRLQSFGDRLTITPGNHDLRVALLQVMFPKAKVVPAFVAHGWTIMHGHKTDPLLDTKTERAVAAISARVIHALKMEWVDSIVERMTSSKRANEPYVQELMKNPIQFKFIIGHTHVPLQLDRFVNTGSISNEEATYVLLTADGKAKLKKFK